MGLFTWVIPPVDMLRDEHQHLVSWQTKDVVNPDMGRFDFVTDEAGKYRLQLTSDNYDECVKILDYHGDMVFYDIDRMGYPEKFVQYRARFDEGILRDIVFLRATEINHFSAAK